jgi:hypothetical protein
LAPKEGWRAALRDRLFAVSQRVSRCAPSEPVITGAASGSEPAIHGLIDFNFHISPTPIAAVLAGIVFGRRNGRS